MMVDKSKMRAALDRMEADYESGDPERQLEIKTMLKDALVGRISDAQVLEVVGVLRQGCEKLVDSQVESLLPTLAVAMVGTEGLSIQIVGMCISFDTHVEKFGTMLTVGKQIKRSSLESGGALPVCVAMLAEAWCAHMKADERRNFLSVEDCPGRREVALLSALTCDRRGLASMRAFSRDSANQIQWTEPAWSDPKVDDVESPLLERFYYGCHQATQEFLASDEG